MCLSIFPAFLNFCNMRRRTLWRRIHKTLKGRRALAVPLRLPIPIERISKKESKAVSKLVSYENENHPTDCLGVELLSRDKGVHSSSKYTIHAWMLDYRLSGRMDVFQPTHSSPVLFVRNRSKMCVDMRTCCIAPPAVHSIYC